MEKNMAALGSKIDLLLQSQGEREVNRRKGMEELRPPEEGADQSEVSREANWRFDGRGRRLEMPVFDGRNPDGWVFRAERFFNMNRMGEMEKLDAAMINLEGDALAWFQWADGRRAIRSWSELKAMIQERFRPMQEGSAYEQFLALR